SVHVSCGLLYVHSVGQARRLSLQLQTHDFTASGKTFSLENGNGDAVIGEEKPHMLRMRHRSKVQVEFFAMTKLNRACPASPSVDRRNCHEFGSVERFFNFFIPINLIHTFMITDELHSEQTLLVAPEHRRYCMSALPPKADMCSAVAHVRFGPKADSCRAAKRHALVLTRSPRPRRSRIVVSGSMHDPEVIRLG